MADNAQNDPTEGSNTTFTHARVPPTAENPHGYPPFNLLCLSTYMNEQIHYYLASGAMLNVNQAELQKQMEDRKALHKIVDWDGNTRENTPTATEPDVPPLNPFTGAASTSSRTLSFEQDSEADSDYPEPPPDHRPIKIAPSDLTKLRYESNITEYNNWLADLRSAFAADPAKYRSGAQRMILASMTFDQQLKTTYNTTVQAHPAITTH